MSSSESNDSMNTNNRPANTPLRELNDADIQVPRGAAMAPQLDTPHPIAPNTSSNSALDGGNSTMQDPSIEMSQVGLTNLLTSMAALTVAVARSRPSGRPTEQYISNLPSREQFLNPNNANGVLALSDPRTNARPQDLCPVCCEDITDLTEAVVVVACGHIYHRDCLQAWFDGSSAQFGTCPMDRRRLFVVRGRGDGDEIGRITNRLLHEVHGVATNRVSNAERTGSGALWSSSSHGGIAEVGLPQSYGSNAALQLLTAEVNRRRAERQRAEESNTVSEDNVSGTEQTAGEASESLFQGETARVRLPPSLRDGQSDRRRVDSIRRAAENSNQR